MHSFIYFFHLEICSCFSNSYPLLGYNFKILTGTHTGKRPLGRRRSNWEDNIRMDPKEIDVSMRNWVDSAQDRDYWKPL